MWTHQVFDVSIPLLQTPGCHGNTLGGSGSRVTVEEKAGKKEEVSSPSHFCNLSAHCGQVCWWTYRWQKGACWLQRKSRTDSSTIVANTEVGETYEEYNSATLLTVLNHPDTLSELLVTAVSVDYTRVYIECVRLTWCQWRRIDCHYLNCSEPLNEVQQTYTAILIQLLPPEKICCGSVCTWYRIGICAGTRNFCKILISFMWVRSVRVFLWHVAQGHKAVGSNISQSACLLTATAFMTQYTGL